uniref:Uncharacterized protein n=1 Tax=Candidatus Kentrum sp. SD TaxID=2126332 RepID=A0A450Z4M0_9GAMM|nr:MAG: hypothetical protein BECKSD772F_GA0070984_11403 [Candidatus Kentron sp. SD]VFK48755.1 MAG: hypothetical protein BECKSD772E_GA0070983_11404 [Candidatus Kentron sp. SD]VFK78404.1 MAG: hypothetical protein BECKSD772D_GA0070982_10149 [Candidatus Kentron sp. SD]
MRIRRATHNTILDVTPLFNVGGDMIQGCSDALYLDALTNRNLLNSKRIAIDEIYYLGNP